MRVKVAQELDGLRMAAETTGPINTVELTQLKRQEWSRELPGEDAAGRQQQLVILIKSVESMLDPEKLRGRNIGIGVVGQPTIGRRSVGQ